MRSVSGVMTRRIELPRYSLPYWKHASTCLTSVMPSGDEPGEQPIVNKIVTSIIGDLNTFLLKLDAVPEGDGTLLDNCAILATTDTSLARTHQIDDFPILIAGSAGGALGPGIHYRSEVKDNASRVPLTLMQAVGATATEFGEGDAKVDAGLSEIEA